MESGDRGQLYYYCHHSTWTCKVLILAVKLCGSTMSMVASGFVTTEYVAKEGSKLCPKNRDNGGRMSEDTLRNMDPYFNP